MNPERLTAAGTENQNPIPPRSTDIILVDTLHLSANLGPDCWDKTRLQPIEITLYLYLVPSYLNTSAASDDVQDSIHYGLLTKNISGLIASQFSESGPRSNDSGDGKENRHSRVDDILYSIAACAFSLGGSSIAEVRVVLSLPKMVLLASGGLSVDATFYHEPTAVKLRYKKVSVQDLVLPVIIGVNPPEREEKQRVVINITFYENLAMDIVSHPLDYQRIISDLVKEMEPTSYLTLEKFVMHIVRFSCLASPKISAVTARAQKPSALTFAGSSGVEITRERSAFV